MLANVVLTLALLWEYDRHYTPAPEVFVISATQAGGAPQQQFRVAPAAPGACTRLPSGAGDSFCTVLACPTPGSVVAYWVQAVWPDQTSAPSNIATCWFRPGDAQCICHDPALAVPPAPPPPPVGPSSPLAGLPPRQTAPPPLPQRTAEGLNLLPIGTLPALPTLPPLPASGGA